ncbi:MAG: penicillin-binding transpeptidase domain-containing protein [Desulfobacterales bacterium]|nr:penicillin-binding transpeptidase domain-containing protein [Desulfobacterales bacterium]MDD4071054.1 penicillin-binding transpeptidase domain-containing protein [Desulfobacterales bacterium]MDD4392451.1 penicillin-binding transpeptidase domain-containing protein [Desulfobacterales bacterium]
MFIKRQHIKDSVKRPSWKQYQSRLRDNEIRKQRVRNIIRSIPFVAVFFFSVCTLTWLGKTALHYVAQRRIDKASCVVTRSGEPAGPVESVVLGGNKEDIRKVLHGKSLVNLQNSSFDIDYENKVLRVDTTLDMSLQAYLIKKMDPSTSRFIAIVVLEPLTGRVLAMTGLDKTDASNNPCINNRFPAASLFKIITASAAIETCGLKLTSPLTYNGGKHTLYKSQIREKISKYTNRITFQSSFAESINPVFGKIGALYLGKTILEQYAVAFGFNQPIGFELELLPSKVLLTSEPYQWAEVASGFNNDTIISPLHGALMVLPVLNQGKLFEPSIIDRIIDENEQSLYSSSQPVLVHQAMTPEASAMVKEMMKATVRYGTSRKAFSGCRKDRVLSRLDIGGKTGSIDNRTHDARYDWFVGFAEEKTGERKIAVSVLVAHEKFIGKRAGYYARVAMKKYFQEYFAGQSATSDHDAT